MDFKYVFTLCLLSSLVTYFYTNKPNCIKVSGKLNECRRENALIELQLNICSSLFRKCIKIMDDCVCYNHGLTKSIVTNVGCYYNDGNLAINVTDRIFEFSKPYSNNVLHEVATKICYSNA